jgi:hypothetical protein
MTGFGAPPDPAYAPFLAGLKQVVADPDGKVHWRWHPKDSKWYAYDPAKYALDDSYRLPDTPPEMALEQNFGWPKSSWELREMFVPDLFSRVRKAYDSISQRYPQATLVWSPWGDGDWRSAFERSNPGPGGGPGPGTELPQECLRQIEQVQQQQRRGWITPDQARRLIAAIIAECAPGVSTR